MCGKIQFENALDLHVKGLKSPKEPLDFTLGAIYKWRYPIGDTKKLQVLDIFEVNIVVTIERDKQDLICS